MRVAFICDVLVEQEDMDGRGQNGVTVKRPAIQLGKRAHSPFPAVYTAPNPTGPQLYVGFADMTTEQIQATVQAVQTAGLRIMFLTSLDDLDRDLPVLARNNLNTLLAEQGVPTVEATERPRAVWTRIMRSLEPTHNVDAQLARLDRHPDELARLKGTLRTTPLPQ